MSITINLVFLLSVVLKGIGAVLEILLQISITKMIGLDGYGSYSAWINGADLVFWCLFSGMIKCNIYYLSREKATLSAFKKKFYLRYVIPVLIVACVIMFIADKPTYYILIGVILAETVVMDRSSVLLARGRYFRSLTGEYVLGRLILLAGVLILGLTGHLSLELAVMLYFIQFVGIFLFLRSKGSSNDLKDVSSKVSLNKLGQYQRADIMQSMIGQMPVILQYFFVGAYEAGVVSIVLLVKKLINFISGPTAKIFLPEFSKLYLAGEKDKLKSCFSMIMRVQMLFVGPLSVALIGYPQVILRILAEEMMAQTTIFAGCSMVFLFAATLGPCGGLMQMIDHEKMDNVCREAAILLMITIFVVMCGNPLFALYGLCVQTFIEAFSKFIFVCRWLGGMPVHINTYFSWWILPVICICISYLLNLNHSAEMMIIMAGGVFLVRILLELRADDSFLNELLKKTKEEAKHES